MTNKEVINNKFTEFLNKMEILDDINGIYKEKSLFIKFCKKYEFETIQEKQTVMKNIFINIRNAVEKQVERVNSIKTEILFKKRKYDLNYIETQNDISKDNCISNILKKIHNFFLVENFCFEEGFEIVHKKYNFFNLNISKQHPAFLDSDTFFINDDMVLSTHTTSTSSKILEEYNNQDSIFNYSIGKCYRNDDVDSTHMKQFYQMDVVALSKKINFSNMLFFVKKFLNYLFDGNVILRYRSSYFPFTTCSYEVDIKCFKKLCKGCNVCTCGWIEILGCGIIHKNVLKLSNVKNNIHGFALGMGIERVIMIKKEISDLRLLYLNDKRLLELIN